MPIKSKKCYITMSASNHMNKYSEKVRGDNYYGYTDGFPQSQVTYSLFVGRLRIQGTLVLEPTDSDWVDPSYRPCKHWIVCRFQALERKWIHSV